eukprot:m.176160 g.176160  ORF g.176160 m.176160 type:complete len:111 (+) comp14895_c0_seq14:3120-3452(+)
MMRWPVAWTLAGLVLVVPPAFAAKDDAGAELAATLIPATITAVRVPLVLSACRLGGADTTVHHRHASSLVDLLTVNRMTVVLNRKHFVNLCHCDPVFSELSRIRHYLTDT